MDSKLNTRVVGNILPVYVCSGLSLDGWNMMSAPTASRIDVVISSQDAVGTATLQIKALTTPERVPLGNSSGKLSGDRR